MWRLFLTRYLARHIFQDAQLGLAPVLSFLMSARNEPKSNRRHEQEMRHVADVWQNGSKPLRARRRHLGTYRKLWRRSKHRLWLTVRISPLLWDSLPRVYEPDWQVLKRRRRQPYTHRQRE